MSDDLRDATRRKLSFWQTLSAVFWLFMGVRGAKSYSEDVGKLNPVHVIIAGVIAAVLFVVLLIVIVQAVAG
jgi:amino acid transporter